MPISISDQDTVTIELIVHYFGLRFLFKIHPLFILFFPEMKISESAEMAIVFEIWKFKG